LALDIRFITLPNSRYFIMSWYLLSVENTNLTGLTKYSLTPDLESLASIKNFPTVAYKMLTLNLLSDNRVIGIGETCITIWSYANGDVLSSMMTSNRIGQNLACVEYSMEVSLWVYEVEAFHAKVTNGWVVNFKIDIFYRFCKKKSYRDFLLNNLSKTSTFCFQQAIFL
jgi:hypothetical protein